MRERERKRESVCCFVEQEGKKKGKENEGDYIRTIRTTLLARRWALVVSQSPWCVIRLARQRSSILTLARDLDTQNVGICQGQGDESTNFVPGSFASQNANR